MANFKLNRKSIEDMIRVRWYNGSYRPAIERALAEKKISKYTADKLLAPYAKLQRERIPTLPDDWMDYLLVQE